MRINVRRFTRACFQLYLVASIPLKYSDCQHAAKLCQHLNIALT